LRPLMLKKGIILDDGKPSRSSRFHRVDLRPSGRKTFISICFATSYCQRGRPSSQFWHSVCFPKRNAFRTRDVKNSETAKEFLKFPIVRHEIERKKPFERQFEFLLLTFSS
jgi:hypothetical protein